MFEGFESRRLPTQETDIHLEKCDTPTATRTSADRSMTTGSARTLAKSSRNFIIFA